MRSNGNHQQSVLLPIDKIRVSSNRRSLQDVSELKQSISELGLLNPISVSSDYLLVAGLHRLEACRQLEWKEIPALVLKLDALKCELAEIDENLIRSDLTVLERGEQLKRRKEIYEALHPSVKHGGAPGKAGGGKSTKDEIISSFATDTSAKTRQSPRTIQQEVQIASDIQDDVKEVIRETDIADNKTELLKLARLDKKKQREVAKRIRKKKAKSVSQAIKEINREERIEQIANAPELKTETRYPVLYADPPWQYDFMSVDAWKVENHYPTMPVEDICALPVEGIATTDAILFLWATAPKLAEALQVISAWGFTYKTCAIWDKEWTGMGNYFRIQHELLLIATKGNIPPPETDNRPASIIKVKRSTKHSEKPSIVYGIIEKMYPELARVELFARKEHAGWAAWGAEIEVTA
jgi:N6-adenosine-specific RNA methylase IME4